MKKVSTTKNKSSIKKSTVKSIKKNISPWVLMALQQQKIIHAKKGT